ncbi:Uncharacterized conserved protein, DUF924 family [Sphingomonas rubra]|uniref:Uncharacterized conserved protein, DUF924 family n=1 Tax=Sphingomonas rubra TaxID=634430 RepID=A0A1I5RZ81_9SPHN|nr:Uncharacterized conserved protein, DUF924 family [Sphingomonas rubra]
MLDFWFALTTDQHFAVDVALDRTIADRFGALHAEVTATRAAEWADDPETLLAAIIVLDQFSRNTFRGSAEAFAQDALATELTLHAIEQGWDTAMPPEHRVFLYLPLMHAEDMALQKLSVAKYEALGIENNLDFARKHRDVIARFGRYPARNAALGRVTTSEEQAFLDEGGGW